MWLLICSGVVMALVIYITAYTQGWKDGRRFGAKEGH